MHMMIVTRLKVSCLIVLVAVGYVIMHPSPSYSNTYSVGGYFTTHVGGYSWNISNSSDNLITLQKPPSRSIPVMTGGGLVWAGEFLDGQFMFRQNLGFEAFMADRFSMTRFSFINTFAYVLSRSDRLTVWAGPQLNLFYIWGKDTTRSGFLYSDYLSTNVPIYKRRTYGLLPIGTGLAFGLDYDVYKNLRLSFEGGFHFSTSVYGKSHEIGNGKASVTGYEGYINVSALYRFGKKNMHDDTDTDTDDDTDMDAEKKRETETYTEPDE